MGTIVDDDTPVVMPAISIDAAAARPEGHVGMTAFNFTVSLSQATTRPVAVLLRTADGTATADDSDYVPMARALVFNPGETSQTVTVQVKGDTKFEGDENFYVSLTNPGNATLAARSTAVATIVNDDAPPPRPRPPPAPAAPAGAEDAQHRRRAAGRGRPRDDDVRLHPHPVEAQHGLRLRGLRHRRRHGDRGRRRLQPGPQPGGHLQAGRDVPDDHRPGPRRSRFEPDEDFFVHITYAYNATLGRDAAGTILDEAKGTIRPTTTCGPRPRGRRGGAVPGAPAAARRSSPSTPGGTGLPPRPEATVSALFLREGRTAGPTDGPVSGASRAPGAGACAGSSGAPDAGAQRRAAEGARVGRVGVGAWVRGEPGRNAGYGDLAIGRPTATARAGDVLRAPETAVWTAE